ncbi:FecR family protein [Parapedobacter deserti]|uniref:FecR family protein n=1 Tax=Parapedobacter deserti TaxID=1912957 RepID=A0ABV7JU22_9SPHI
MGGSEILELIAKHLSNESTTDEDIVLASWINSSEANQRLYEQVKRAWAESQPASDPERLARGKAMVFGRIREEASQANNYSLPTPRWWKKAPIVRVAAASLLVALSWFGYIGIATLSQQRSTAFVNVENNGELKEVLLPDGSTIWLHSESQIQYADNFSGKTREIFLNGEAFFDVKRDVSKPFIVHAGSLTTRVLGTSFTIRAYAEQSDVEITVSSGKVSVSDSAGVIGELEKDQQLSYQKSTGRFTSQPVESHSTSLWKSGELVFDMETFEEVARILERRYNVQIQFDNSKIKNYPISARFSKDEPLQQILHMLGLVTDTESIFNDGTNIIWIREKNRKNNNVDNRPMEK